MAQQKRHTLSAAHTHQLNVYCSEYDGPPMQTLAKFASAAASHLGFDVYVSHVRSSILAVGRETGEFSLRAAALAGDTSETTAERCRALEVRVDKLERMVARTLGRVLQLERMNAPLFTGHDDD